MLLPAIQYKELLEREMNKIIDDPYFDYLHGAFCDKGEITASNWLKHQFVSVDLSLNVVGYLEASITRTSRMIDNLVLINFKKGWNATFAKDLKKFIILLFFRYNYRKIKFSVTTGTRNERIYDKFINRYGGRIVGIFQQDFMLQSGEIRDMKHYEIFREDFIKKFSELHTKVMEK